MKKKKQNKKKNNNKWNQDWNNSKGSKTPRIKTNIEQRLTPKTKRTKTNKNIWTMTKRTEEKYLQFQIF